MNRDQKSAVVDEIADQIRASAAVFAVDYRGLSVVQAADLRARLRESETRFRVVKNSLTDRAADKAGADSLRGLLEGPTALALVSGDAALAAKALNDAARAFNTLDFKGGLLDGSALTADDVRAIARLPAREILNAQLVGTVAAPLTGLARGLNALISGLAIALKEIADRGLVSGDEAAATAPPEAPVASADSGDREPEAPVPSADSGEGEPEAPVASAGSGEGEPEAPVASAGSGEGEPEAPVASAGSGEGQSEAPVASAGSQAPMAAGEPEAPVGPAQPDPPSPPAEPDTGDEPAPPDSPTPAGDPEAPTGPAPAAESQAPTTDQDSTADNQPPSA